MLEKIVSKQSNGKMINSTARKRKGPSTFRCASCKFNKKKCSDKCILAPYFQLDDPQKFQLVHTVFGNGHVNKILMDLPAEQRGDAVSSMVYEARQRLKDPVHGCAGIINDLHKKLAELQSQLDSTQEHLANISVRHANLLSLVTNYHETLVPQFYDSLQQESEVTCTIPNELDDGINPMQLLEPLWP